MKIYHHILLAILACCTLCSCDTLEFDETQALNTRENIYKYFNNTKEMLTNVYSYVPQDFGAIGNAMRDCACDDAEFGNSGGGIQDFNNGNWSAIRTYDTAWSLYNGIRAANEFIESFATTDFSRFQYDTSYPNWERQLRYFPNEARILRAFYFFELARRYGDIAMPLKRLSIAEANSIGKTPFDEVVEFIVDECDQCAAEGMLPDSYVGEPGNETGRVTRGFAMALKTKALLYAASKLHNPDMDKARWERTALAALALINSGLYTLDPADKCNNNTSPEIVMMRMNTNSNNFELLNFPIRFTQNRRSTLATGTFPTQNLVDAFQTRAGYDVSLGSNGWQCDDPAFNPRAPYANRDVRFGRAIMADGTPFKGEIIESFIGGADYASVNLGGTPTGYFLHKYIREATNFNPNNPVSDKHHWIIYRYAETLLTYAEAMTEAFGDPTYSDATFVYSAQWALNQVRTNASMPPVMVTEYTAFMDALRREWRVEFAFEDHRFWDIRRWCIGEYTQKDIYGVEIRRDGQNKSYRRISVEKRVWHDRMYLYPIPQAELFKNANLFPQNPGW